MASTTPFEFDGTASDYFGVAIVAAIISSITLGIGVPWAVCMVQKWRNEHTTIDGRRLQFTGNGADLFGKYIVWAILTAITFGIYSFWVVPAMQKWIAEHTDFA